MHAYLCANHLPMPSTASNPANHHNKRGPGRAQRYREHHDRTTASSVMTEVERPMLAAGWNPPAAVRSPERCDYDEKCLDGHKHGVLTMK
jgi:hypothetical protein